VNDIESMDPFAAVRDGLICVNNILSYMQIEYGQIQGNIAKKCVIVSPIKMIMKSNEPSVAMSPIKSTPTNRDWLINRLAAIKEPSIKDQFVNSLRWYGLSVVNNDDVNKFLTLWIALETLAGHKIEEAECPFIAKIVSCALGLYFMRKSLRNMWANFYRLGIHTSIAEKFDVYFYFGRL